MNNTNCGKWYEMEYSDKSNMDEAYIHITKWNKAIWKGYILYESNCMIVEKAKLWKQWKDQWLPGVGGRERRIEHREFLRQWKYSVWYQMMGTCHYTFVQTHRMYNTKSEL